MTRALSLALVLASTLAHADAPIDLRVKRMPVRLKMRAPTTAQTPAPEPASDGPVITAFTPIPTTTRDIKDRVIFKLRAGVELDGAGASGDPLRGGAPLPAGFEEGRPWILGDVVVGARDMVVPSLGGYFLSAFRLNAIDTAAERSALVVPGDATGQRIAIKAGYVEYGADDKRPEQKLWVRAGRQYRLDGGNLFAYFDGVTVGLRNYGPSRALTLSAFVGQRVGLYVDSERGVLYGATAAKEWKFSSGARVRGNLDFMGLSIATEDDRDSRTLVAALLAYKRGRIDIAARARFVQQGGDQGLGRIGARATYEPSRTLVVIGDVEHRGGGDLAYDLAAPSAVDVVDISRRLGVGLADPIAATTVGARIDWRRKSTELLGFARAELPSGTPTRAEHRGWIEAGGAVAGSPLTLAKLGLWTTAQYKLRTYSDESDGELMDDFADTSSSGLTRMHELAADATARGTGKLKWRGALGAFYRIYDLRTPYLEVAHEGRAGGRADAQLWITPELRLDVAFEIAQAAPVLDRELGTLTAVRAAVEARW